MATKKIVKAAAPAKPKKAAPAAKKAVTKKATSTKSVPDTELIRKKAQEIYHARIARGEHGTADGDWHLAEKLIKEGGKTTAKKVVAKKVVAKKAVAKKPVTKKK